MPKKVSTKKNKRACSGTEGMMDAEPAPSPPPEPIAEVEYDEPTSPYRSPIVTMTIGSAQYSVQESFVQRYPQLHSRIKCGGDPLKDADDDIGHTIVHFLYTGIYETLEAPKETGKSILDREYTRSTSVYQAALVVGMNDLADAAKRYIKSFEESMSIFKTLSAAKRILSKLPDDEAWFLDHVKTKIRDTFASDADLLRSEEFYDMLGEDRAFDKAVMRMVVDVFHEAMSSTIRTNQENVQRLASLEERVAETQEAAEDSTDLSCVPSPETECLEPEYPRCGFPRPCTSPESPSEPPHEGSELEDFMHEEPLPVFDDHEQDIASECVANVDEAEENINETSSDIVVLTPPPTEHAEPETYESEGIVVDVDIYDNWSSLTSSVRESREKLLWARGLPVPSPDGTFNHKS